MSKAKNRIKKAKKNLKPKLPKIPRLDLTKVGTIIEGTLESVAGNWVVSVEPDHKIDLGPVFSKFVGKEVRITVADLKELERTLADYNPPPTPEVTPEEPRKSHPFEVAQLTNAQIREILRKKS